MMPRARNRWQRCRQMLEWAKTEFAVPPETRLVVVPKIIYRGDECAGLTGRGGRGGGMVITLASRVILNEFCAIMVMEHEIAHAVTYDKGRGILHGPSFHHVHGLVQDHWEHHGISDADTYPTE